MTVRNVFVVRFDKKITLILVYPMTTGRNFDEVLRAIDSSQLTAKHKLATPVNWKQGDGVIIAGFGVGRRSEEDVPGWLASSAAVSSHRAAAGGVRLFSTPLAGHGRHKRRPLVGHGDLVMTSLTRSSRYSASFVSDAAFPGSY